LFLQSTVDKLLKKANLSLVVGTSSWREQFVEAITVSAGRCEHAIYSHHCTRTVRLGRESVVVAAIILNFCPLCSSEQSRDEEGGN
jgi:hypothetical protein